MVPVVFSQANLTVEPLSKSSPTNYCSNRLVFRVIGADMGYHTAAAEIDVCCSSVLARRTLRIAFAVCCVCAVVCGRPIYAHCTTSAKRCPLVQMFSSGRQDCCFPVGLDRHGAAAPVVPRQAAVVADIGPGIR